MSEFQDKEQPLKQAEVLNYLVENGRLKDDDGSRAWGFGAIFDLEH